MENSFGAYLKFLRQRAGIKQSEMAHILGVSGAYASNVEKNHKNPIMDPAKLKILCDAFHCSDAEADHLMDLSVQGKNRACAPDIALYLGECPKAREVIRFGRRNGLTDDDWDRILELLELNYGPGSEHASQKD